MKTVIITGPSSGIGRAIAEDLSSTNTNLVLVSRNVDKVNAYVGDLKGEVLVKKADVRDVDQINQVVAEAKKQFGSIDVLVNNAGLGLFRFVCRREVVRMA